MTHLHALATKIIYALFILWLGVLAPLIYFDGFAANHHVQPYRFALFEKGNRVTALPLSVAPQAEQELRQRFARQLDVISNGSFFPGLLHSLQWSLSQLYLTAGVAGFLLLFARRFSLVEQLPATSLPLPPSAPPPRRA
jgi:hypothetical protein